MIASRRVTTEQVVDFITGTEDELEEVDIDLRDIENDRDSDDGDAEEADYLTANCSSELIPSQLLTGSGIAAMTALMDFGKPDWTGPLFTCRFHTGTPERSAIRFLPC